MPERSVSTPGTEIPRDLTETGYRVLQGLSLGLVVFDPTFRIIHHNPAAGFLVKDHTSIVDALTAATVDAQYRDWTRLLQEVIDTSQPQRVDQVLFREGRGEERLLNLTCLALPDDTDSTRAMGGTLVIEDVTAVVGMEQRLAVSERMAAVGKLAARVAHELNNPLDGILRYLNLAIRANEIGSAEKIGDYLTRARGGLLRMAEIIRELSEFSRGASTTFDDASINNVVEEAIKVMSDKAVANGVSVVCTLSDELPAVPGTSLFQVFCNLIKNACDAMPSGGTLTVTTALSENREAVIRFADTGEGLPEDLDRLFEPFFTTKPSGQGTGLGLAISRDIVEKYNGRIVPERREEGGAMFTVIIPLSERMMNPAGAGRAGG